MRDSLPAWTDEAVLVYGARKSGSTLFQNLLDGTSEMLAYPAELKLKLLARLPAASLTREAYLSESRVPEAAAGHLDIAAYRRLWQSMPPDGVDGNLRSLMRHDAWAVQQSAAKAPRQPQLWCAKEVGGDAETVLGLWRRTFPNGRVLFITRDPAMITRAVLNDRRRKGIKPSFWRILYEAADPVRVTQHQATKAREPWIHTVRYEDLVTDPASVMQKAAAFLGITYDPILTRPTVFGEPVVVSTSSRPEKAVFHSEARWTDGLTAREIAAAKLGRGLANLGLWR